MFYVIATPSCEVGPFLKMGRAVVEARRQALLHTAPIKIHRVEVFRDPSDGEKEEVYTFLCEVQP